jgi:hypothetical protein
MSSLSYSDMTCSEGTVCLLTAVSVSECYECSRRCVRFCIYTWEPSFHSCFMRRAELKWPVAAESLLHTLQCRCCYTPPPPPPPPPPVVTCCECIRSVSWTAPDLIFDIGFALYGRTQNKHCLVSAVTTGFMSGGMHMENKTVVAAFYGPYCTQDCSVCMAQVSTSYRISGTPVSVGARIMNGEGLSSSPGRGKKCFHVVQNGSGVHPTSYSMVTGDCFTGGKAAGAWNWSFTSIWCQGHENVDLYNCFPTRLHRIVKHRDTFTFTFICLCLRRYCEIAILLSMHSVNF